jgi:site-specific DNA-methyltransferase (adenine-specific)
MNLNRQLTAETRSSLCKDSVDALRTLPHGSVQLIITSPPYDNLRTYGGHSWDFQGTAQELYRVLCAGGIVCWNVNDAVVDGSETLTSFRQAIYFKDICGFRMHDTMIYEKSNGSKPDATRYNSCAEYIFILTKGKPRCFNPIKDKRNVTAGRSCFGLHTMRNRDGSISIRNERRIAAEFGMRSNIWRGKTRGQEEVCRALPHPAMMPRWLARDLIFSWSMDGDLVADPFAGSGTVGQEAFKLGRRYWLNDINPEYAPLLNDRRIQKL